jgi:hypothetical protein
MTPVAGSPPLTPEKDERLRKLALTGISVAAMAKQMHRSMVAVRNRDARLKLVVAKSHNQGLGHTSSHPGQVWISLRAICFSSSIDIRVLFIRVLRFHVIAAQQLVATLSLAQARASNSQPASRVQILSGHYNTAVRVPLPLQLRESEMFDLGSVPYKDSDELCIACVLSAHTLSVQKGSLRYPALFDFAAVLHNEMDVIAASNNHENGPQTG